MGALWAPPEDVETYLSSITTLDRPHEDTVNSISPQRLLGSHFPTDCEWQEPTPAPLTTLIFADHGFQIPSFPLPHRPPPLATSVAHQDHQHAGQAGIQEMCQRQTVSCTFGPGIGDATRSRQDETPLTMPAQSRKSSSSSLTSPAAASTSYSTTPTDDDMKPRPRFACQHGQCTRAFRSQKDLGRHLDSVHRKSAAFRCRCGKTFPRKDNHDRHVRGCRKEPVTSFRCRCGSEADMIVGHLEHIQSWSMSGGCCPPTPTAA